MVPVAAMVGMGVSAAIAMLLPAGALIWLITRRAPDGTRRYPQLGRAFVCGMLAFAVSQVLTRLPLMAFLSTVQQPWAAVLVSAPVASFTAGLFEETGRLLIMLWLLKRFHRWVDGVSFGLGHGGPGWCRCALVGPPSPTAPGSTSTSTTAREQPTRCGVPVVDRLTARQPGQAESYRFRLALPT